jgi:hypothetical protein
VDRLLLDAHSTLADCGCCDRAECDHTGVTTERTTFATGAQNIAMPMPEMAKGATKCQ